MEPLVSVLMPMRNASASLAATLRSLRAQTYEQFELVLIDDGSQDASAVLAEQLWGDAQQPLKLLRPGRVGLVAALNFGLAHCTAKLIARMDADDIASPDRVSEQVRYLTQHPEVAVVGSLVRCFTDPAGGDEVGTGYTLYEAWLNGLVAHEQIMREIFIESPLAHPSVMMRREAVLALGGYRDMGWAEDYDLWLRLANAGQRFGKVERVLLHWRDYPERTSRTDPAYAHAAFQRCKAHHLARGPLVGGKRVAIWGAGPVGRGLGRALLAEGVELAGFVDVDPHKIGKTRHGVPVVAPAHLPHLGCDLVLAAVGSRGARELIRRELLAMGLWEGRDFLCAA